ncbi:MAG: O-antigen ligase family protein [Clostridiales bacterium]|nr:O-antigen ligase family protein [Clostridiales bacterium]MDD6292331.1 O-antigen ligase family protein [Eubacteriales bacterium]
MYQKLKECKSIKEIYEVIPEEFYEKCAVVLIFFMNMVIVVESLTRIIIHRNSFETMVRNYYIVGTLSVIYAIVYIISKLYKFTFREIREYFKNNIWEVFFLILFLFTTLSIGVACDKQKAFQGHWFRQNGIRSYCIYLSMYITGKTLCSKKSRKIILWTIAITSTIQDIIILMKYLGYYGSYSGGFYNSNHSGYYITMAIFALAGLMIFEQKNIFKSIAAILYAFNIMCLVINNTFGCYIAVMFGIAFMLILNVMKCASISSGCVMMIVIFLIMSIVMNRETGNISHNFNITSNDIENISKRNGEAKNAGTGRMELWMSALDVIRHKPVMGCGAENIEDEKECIGVPHNEFLQIAAEYGVVACLSYIVGLITLMIRKLRNLKNENEYTIACGGIVFAYLVSSMFGVMMFYTAVFYYTFLGMVSNDRNSTQYDNIGKNT